MITVNTLYVCGEISLHIRSLALVTSSGTKKKFKVPMYTWGVALKLGQDSHLHILYMHIYEYMHEDIWKYSWHLTVFGIQKNAVPNPRVRRSSDPTKIDKWQLDCICWIQPRPTTALTHVFMILPSGRANQGWPEMLCSLKQKLCHTINWHTQNQCDCVSDCHQVNWTCSKSGQHSRV